MEKGKKNQKEKSEEEKYPFDQIEKFSVVQQSKVEFNKNSISPNKCIYILKQILYLVGQGVTFTPDEATDMFFNSTKLFISEDPQLRRLLYVVIKELSVYADTAFAASNILYRDMNNNKNTTKASAIRSLMTISDESMATKIDMFLKQSIVSTVPTIASAALIYGLNLPPSNENVKRWAGEIQSVIKKPPKGSYMVQYHALSLLYKLRKNDPLAVSKLVSSNVSDITSPLAHCNHIRYSVMVLNNLKSLNEDSQTKSILGYLEKCLSNESDMVALQAARGLCSVKHLGPKQLTSAVTALENLLASHKPVNRFAAIRTLNSLAQKYPLLVSLCNTEMENLISDKNRGISTLAITTLLRTGNESNIDSLIKQITKFMVDIPSEFKITVIESIRALSLKYKTKYEVILSFLSSSLKRPGEYSFKKSIVDTIIEIMTSIPESKEEGIKCLCEVIEDCEYTALLKMVLYYLGEEGPKSKNPSTCIRYIYNRIHLEHSSVRACAITTLAKFAALVSKLNSSILVILKRCQEDVDDEVRDRAVFFLSILESGKPELINEFILNANKTKTKTGEEQSILSVQNINNLKSNLLNYKSNEENLKKPFDLNDVVDNSKVKKEDKTEKEKEKVDNGLSLNTKNDEKEQEKEVSSEDQLSILYKKFPKLSKLGKPFTSSKLSYLTEDDFDYTVSYIKHIFQNYILFECFVSNKVTTHQLENITLKLDLSSQPYLKEKLNVKLSKLAYGSTDTIPILCSKHPKKLPFGSLGISLHFQVKEVDSEGNVDEEVDEDEHDLDKIKIEINDFVSETTANFKPEWQELENNQTVVKSKMKKSLSDAVESVVSVMGINSLNDQKVKKDTPVHTLFFAGNYLNGSKALVVVKLTQQKTGTSLETAVRSQDEEVRDFVAKAIKSKK